MPPHGRQLHCNRLSGTIPAFITHLSGLTTLCAHSLSIPSLPFSLHPLSPILSPSPSLPFSLHPPLSHSLSIPLSPILSPSPSLPFSLPFSLHPPLSHSLSIPSLPFSFHPLSPILSPSPLSHSLSIPLSPILSPSPSLPFSLHPSLSHSLSIPLSPILSPSPSLPTSLHTPLSHSLSTPLSPILPTPLASFCIPLTPLDHPFLPPPCIQWLFFLSPSPLFPSPPSHLRPSPHLPPPFRPPPTLFMLQETSEQQQSLRLHSRGNQQPQAAKGVVSGDGELTLFDNGLSGSIPDAISSLQLLQELDLHCNRLSGTIPACITHLTALTSLCAHSPSTPPSPSPLSMPSFRLPLSAKHWGSVSLKAQTFQQQHSYFSKAPYLLSYPPHLLTSPPLLLSSSPLLLLSPSSSPLLLLSSSQLSLFVSSPRHLFPSSSLLSFMSIHPPVFRMLNANHLAGTIPAAITTLTNLEILHLENNQLTGELPSFHHIARLTSQYGLSADHNYLTSTADPFPFYATGQDSPSESHSLCLFDHNCLENDAISCASWQNQRYGSECRAFCGAQPLTPPCSGHGVCSFVPDPSYDMSACEDEHELPPPYCAREPEGQCDCDEGYTPGTAAGTCVPHGIAAVGVTLALAARQAAMGAEINC
ncbi:unnamed protein product [Closterium sp. Naga37s-1]|nr:unnamed protein product [Closterium sp. Naga37s-1]